MLLLGTEICLPSPRKAQLHPRGSVLFRCILLLIIRAEPIKPSIITVISPLFILMQFPISEVIMSNFFSHGGSFWVDKRDGALKENVLLLQQGKKRNRCAAISSLFPQTSATRFANCLQVYIT